MSEKSNKMTISVSQRHKKSRKCTFLRLKAAFSENVFPSLAGNIKFHYHRIVQIKIDMKQNDGYLKRSPTEAPCEGETSDLMRGGSTHCAVD